MAAAEPAYSLSAYPSYAPDIRRERKRSERDVRVVRTGGAPQTKAGSSALVMLGKAAAVVLVFMAVLCFARIALTNATVTTLIESDTMSTQIEKARSAGTSLEMEQSALTSTSALKGAVKRLGMAAPYSIDTIALDPDVVTTTATGDLSLSGSLKKVVEVQG